MIVFYSILHISDDDDNGNNNNVSNATIYSGEDDQGCEYVRMGGDGVISVTANVAPNKMHRFVSACVSVIECVIEYVGV